MKPDNLKLPVDERWFYKVSMGRIRLATSQRAAQAINEVEALRAERDDWRHVANIRSAEIIRLMKELDRLKGQSSLCQPA
jgi:hypothetical protein